MASLFLVAHLLDSPTDVHRRLKPKHHLDLVEEILRVSEQTGFRS